MRKHAGLCGIDPIRMPPFASLLLVLVLCFAGCRHEPPEQALRKQVVALQAAIEQHDGAAMADVLAEDFIGNDGLDRRGARQLAQLYFMRNREVGVTLGPLDVALQGEHATVKCTVLLTGGSGRLLPESGRGYDITSGWRLQSGDWVLTSLEWTPR